MNIIEPSGPGSPIVQSLVIPTAISALALSEDGETLAVASPDGKLGWWDLSSEPSVRTISTKKLAAVRALAFCDKTLFAAADKGIGTVDAGGATLVSKSKVPVVTIALPQSPTGSTNEALIAMGLQDGGGGLVHRESGKVRLSLKAEGTPIVSMALDANATRLVAMYASGVIKLWDVSGKSPKMIRSVAGPPNRGGHLVYDATRDLVHMLIRAEYDAAEDAVHKYTYRDALVSMQMSDGKVVRGDAVLAGNSASNFRIWTFPLAFHQDGMLLGGRQMGGADVLTGWKVDDDTPSPEFEHAVGNRIMHCAVAAEAERVLVATTTKIELLSLARLRDSVVHSHGNHAVSHDVQDDHIALLGPAEGYREQATLWNVRTRQLVFRVPAHVTAAWAIPKDAETEGGPSILAVRDGALELWHAPWVEARGLGSADGGPDVCFAQKQCFLRQRDAIHRIDLSSGDRETYSCTEPLLSMAAIGDRLYALCQDHLFTLSAKTFEELDRMKHKKLNPRTLDLREFSVCGDGTVAIARELILRGYDLASRKELKLPWLSAGYGHGFAPNGACIAMGREGITAFEPVGGNVIWKTEAGSPGLSGAALLAGGRLVVTMKAHSLTLVRTHDGAELASMECTGREPSNILGTADWVALLDDQGGLRFFSFGRDELNKCGVDLDDPPSPLALIPIPHQTKKSVPKKKT